MKKKRPLKVVPKVVLGSVFVTVIPSLAGCGKSRQDVQSPVAQMMTVAMMMPVDAAAPTPAEPNGVARAAFTPDAGSPPKKK